MEEPQLSENKNDAKHDKLGRFSEKLLIIMFVILFFLYPITRDEDVLLYMFWIVAALVFGCIANGINMYILYERERKKREVQMRAEAELHAKRKKRIEAELREERNKNAAAGTQELRVRQDRKDAQVASTR